MYLHIFRLAVLVSPKNICSKNAKRFLLCREGNSTKEIDSSFKPYHTVYASHHCDYLHCYNIYGFLWLLKRKQIKLSFPCKLYRNYRLSPYFTSSMNLFSVSTITFCDTDVMYGRSPINAPPPLVCAILLSSVFMNCHTR